MAAGDVLRYDGVHLLPSGPHRNAILQTRLRTTIHKTPSLMYDTTAWNKVFRTAFWRMPDCSSRPVSPTRISR
jgi:CDP-glycerol glycerophosphotransferase